MPAALRPTCLGPALLTSLCVILLLLHREASCYNLTIADLPPTKQHNKRLLVAITVDENVTNHYVTKQLLNYAEACEAGFEVHVVLVTFPTVWDNADKILFPTPSRYYCLRLQQLLPVVVASDLPDGMAHMHRHVFSQLVNKYDLFLDQEHDMDIRARHLLYWTHWQHYYKTHPSVPLSDKPIIPGFLRHEVSMRPQNHQLWLHPSPLLHFDSPVAILTIGNVTCFAPEKTYPGFYIIDREMLQLAMSKAAWKTDAKKDYGEYNTHHHGQWQWHYFHQAIPLTAMQGSMVHHGSDKYTPAFIEDSSNYSESQFRDPGFEGGIDVVELEYMISNCLGRRWDGSKLRFPYPSLQGSNTVVEYGSCRGWLPKWLPKWFHVVSGCLGSNPNPKGGRGPTPCADCASQGKGAALIYRLAGPTLAARPTKPRGLFMVDVSCITGLPQQLLMPCKNKGCDDYFVNATTY